MQSGSDFLSGTILLTKKGKQYYTVKLLIMGRFRTGMVIGAIAGAAVAYFLQTDKGRRILEDAEDELNDFREQASEASSDFTATARKKIRKAGSKVSDTFKGVKNAAEDTAENFKNATKESKDDTEAQFS